eukprot:gene6762-8386_t
MTRFTRQLTNIINQVKSKPNPVVLFATGNYGDMSSRSSVGIKAVDSFVSKFNLQWNHFPQNCSKLAYSPENHLLVCKSDTYLLKDNFEVLKRLLVLMPNIKTENFVAVHYEHLYKLGIVESLFGGRTRHNDSLKGITSVFSTENYNRIAIGIAHPIDSYSYEVTPFSMGEVYENTITPFVLNRFPQVQMQLVDEVVVPHTVNEISKLIGKINSHNTTKDLSETEFQQNLLSSFRSPRVNYDQVDSQ